MSSSGPRAARGTDTRSVAQPAELEVVAVQVGELALQPRRHGALQLQHILPDTEQEAGCSAVRRTGDAAARGGCPVDQRDGAVGFLTRLDELDRLKTVTRIGTHTEVTKHR